MYWNRLNHPAVLNQSFADLDSLFREFFQPKVPTAQHFPEIAVWASESSAVVEVELPGFKQQDIEIDVLRDELFLKFERTAPENQEKVKRHLNQRKFGQFEKTLRLPFLVDAEGVKAELKDGILTIELPKAASEKRRKIAINS